MLLLCLPHAGAGPSTFYSWPELAPDGLEVHPVPLPGRDRQMFDPPYLDVHEAVKGVADELAPVLSDGRPLALFGHCLGALLAYELARHLRDNEGRAVSHLLVSGTAAPSDRRRQRITGLPDEEFLDRVADIAGYRHSAFDDPDLRELLLPTLRADVQMQEDYRPGSTGPLDIPVTAVRGASDELVSRADIAGWRATTTGAFATVEVPGGHMYFLDQPRRLMEVAAGGAS